MSPASMTLPFVATSIVAPLFSVLAVPFSVAPMPTEIVPPLLLMMPADSDLPSPMVTVPVLVSVVMPVKLPPVTFRLAPAPVLSKVPLPVSAPATLNVPPLLAIGPPIEPEAFTVAVLVNEAKLLEPEIVVVPAVVLMTAVPPPMPLIVPPVEPTAPVRLPFFSVPPARLTVLIACARPPRSSVPPALMVVALPALNAFAAPPFSVPPLIVVAPA